MPKKATSHKDSKNRQRQTRLTGFLPSSSNKSSHKTSLKRTRKITTPSSDESTGTEKSADCGSHSDVGAIRFEAETVDIDDEDESPRRPKRRRTTDRFDENGVDDDEERIGVPVHWKGKGKIKTIVDSDDESQPRRKLIRGVRPPTPEDDDDSVDEAQILESRLRTRGRQTKYQKSLQKIKKLKGTKRDQVVLESSEESPEEDSDSDDSEQERSSAVDGDDDDFIVEDHGKSTHNISLPAEFSMNTHQDLAHQFKIICQLFVHMAVRPLPERRPFMKHVIKSEEYFSVPLQVTRRKLFGMRDSLVASSVWGPYFKKALEKYPELTLIRMDFTVPGCDACHLGGRNSTLLGRLSGAPYDTYDYEDLTDDESDDNETSISADDSDTESSVKKEFHLGRFCAARTRVYHEFNHWEHSLYMSLQREITAAQDDDNKFVRVAYEGGALPPDNLEDADKTMDWLDQRGIIDMEWHKVRRMMDSARNLEISAKRGDNDTTDPGGWFRSLESL